MPHLYGHRRPEPMTVERFLAQTEPVPMAGCFLWTGTNHGNGYGQLYMGRLRVYAHRLAHELFIGPVPDGLCVLHKCDVPPCVNPAHLFLGTRTDNAADKVAKGRARGRARGRRTGVAA